MSDGIFTYEENDQHDVDGVLWWMMMMDDDDDDDG